MFTPALVVVGAVAVVLLIAAVVVMLSFHNIGQTEVGLVSKKFSWSKITDDNPVSFNGEAGYQGELLMPGWRFKLSLLYSVEKFPWVQVPAGEIGVVISQVGDSLPAGAKSAVYKSEFGHFTDLKNFIEKGGQKGVQRLVLPPGTLAPMHPVAFLVITSEEVYGLPVSPDLADKLDDNGILSPTSFGLTKEELEVVRIEPLEDDDGKITDMVGMITAHEGLPLDPGDIACRLSGFEDIQKAEKAKESDAKLVERVLASKNNQHNNYQDFQKFLEAGGRIGLQHDLLLYGTYNLNPFLVKVEKVPMLVVQQGEVAVVKSYVGLPTEDTSGAEFKHGSLVKPGHRGIWEEPLRTGKYPINPRCYQVEKVPTAILTLNWADATSKAHDLDGGLQQITAKSCEGFVFKLDLQVQIHVPDTLAPKVISQVGNMKNLVNEVLQAAVGNHFRDTLQSIPAIQFINTRKEVQVVAQDVIKKKLEEYHVETRGVYIQDVILPVELVKVLTEREIASQQIETFKRQKDAQDNRVSMERSKGTADMQADLAKSEVGVAIQTNKTQARKTEADGEAEYTEKIGHAKGAEVEAIGMARAKGYEAQMKALGASATALVNVVAELSKSSSKFMPEILVTGGSAGSMDGLAGTLMQFLRSGAEAKALETTEAKKS